MGAIIPAILPKSREDLEAKLDRIRGLAGHVQVDIVDGSYAAPATWPYDVGSNQEPSAGNGADLLADFGSFRFEVDLMVREPERALRRWVEAGASRVTVHAESATNLDKVLEEFRVTYGHDKQFAPELLSLGLAIGIETDIALVEPYLDRCEYVQFMGIARVGKQGQPFDRRVLAKIAALRRAHPDVLIQVDGGVSLETAPELLQAGVTALVIGSALWNAPDIAARLAEFKALTTQYGLSV